MALAPPQPGWCDVIREYAATETDGAAPHRATSCVRGGRARLLPAPRAMESRRGGPRDAWWARGRSSSCSRQGRDRARGTRGAALAVPARARAGAGGRPLVVRRPGSGRARRVASGSSSGRCACVPESRRSGLPRAGGPRSRPRGTRRRSASGGRPGPLVTLGRALRPAGHAPRLDGRRSAGPRRLKPRRARAVA